MATEQRETREQRIKRETAELALRPWQFAPSHVFLDGNPYERDKTTAGYTSWKVAQQQRLELYRRDPLYFHDDCADFDEQSTKGK